MKRMQYDVTAIVVSYNREDLLRECLYAIQSQTRAPDRLIIVDNASTDNALQVAQTFAEQSTIPTSIQELSSNTGGAGGFSAGIALAAARVHAAQGALPYLWIMDDDTIPQNTALEELLAAADSCIEENHCAPTALGSKAIWVDGREHLMNKPRPRRCPVKGSEHLRAFPDAYQVRSLSFVSCLLNLDAIRTMKRFPRAAYFLWNDDFEYTTALLKTHIGYYVPASVVVHKTRVFGSSDADPGARFYNEVRNKIWMLRFSRDTFTALELPIFILKLVRRWTLAWLRAGDRELIHDCFVRGWYDGWHTDPQSNQEILQAAGCSIDDLQ